MKKIIAIALLGLGTVVGYSQGTIVIQNTQAAYLISTNTAAYGSGQNGVSGLTANVANTFYYALLVQSYTGSLTTVDPTSPSWAVGLTGTNVVAGGIKGPGGAAGAAVTGWGAPTGSAYNTGTQDYYALVGWSANLGTTWSQVEAQLASGNWIGNGFFGVSALGYGYSGGGPNTLNAPSIFGTGVNPGGLTSGFSLFSVGGAPVPEPGTMALAGLGIASLLALRRKK